MSGIQLEEGFDSVTIKDCRITPSAGSIRRKSKGDDRTVLGMMAVLLVVNLVISLVALIRPIIREQQAKEAVMESLEEWRDDVAASAAKFEADEEERLKMLEDSWKEDR
jgi:hypothetical protein